MDYGQILNQIGRSYEVQSIYQQSLMQSELEIKQAAQRLEARRKQAELDVPDVAEVKPEAETDLELSHRQAPRAKYGPGRHLDIQA